MQPDWNTSSVTYRIIGDNTSVTAVFDALVANCTVANSSTAITAFDPSPLTYPLPEQVIQYYRASSLALSLDGYNNTAALILNMPASNSSAPITMPDTPLPANVNMTFLACINLTTGASVPLVDAPGHKKLSASTIGGTIGGSLLGLAVLIFIWIWIASWSCWWYWNPKNWHLRRRMRGLKAKKSVPKEQVVEPADGAALMELLKKDAFRSVFFRPL